MKIGKLAEKTGISEYTLRYYEKKGLIRVGRDASGRREFFESDIEWILFIKRLKDTGMLLRDIKKYAFLRYEGDSTIGERLLMLEEHRVFVLQQREKWDDYLKNLDTKIEIYKGKLT